MTRRGEWQASEHEEQCAVMNWAMLMERVYPDLEMLFSVPNGARTSMGTAKKLKAEGLKAGIPDLILLVPRGKWHGLLIEMKREKAPPSSLSEAQRWWRDHLIAQGYCATVAFGSLQAINMIEEYLNG